MQRLFKCIDHTVHLIASYGADWVKLWLIFKILAMQHTLQTTGAKMIW